MNKKNLIYGILKEITQGNQNQTPKPIIRVEDSKITKFIISFFEKRKDADLIVLNSNGDIWTIDVRAIVISDDDKQTIRERAKALTYQVKRELEETLMKEFAIPNMSIQGIKPVQNNTCDFVISFIYSNKNVDRTNFYENKNPKIVEMLKEILKESELSKKDQKEVKKFTDAYHKFTEQGKTTEAKQALKLATEAEENITKCKTSIAKLNESKQSLTEDNYQSLLSKISPSWLNNSYVTNVIDGKEVDLYTIAPQEERDLVLKGYLNFSEEQLKTMNEEEKKNLFNANIFHASLKAKSKSAKPKNRRLSLSQWAKQEGRNINEVGIEKDYKANYLNKRGLTEDVSRFNEIFDKVIPVIDVNVLNKSKQVETINNKTLYQLLDGRMYCQMNPTKGVVTNDKVNNPQEFTNWFSMILREGKQLNKKQLKEEFHGSNSTPEILEFDGVTVANYTGNKVDKVLGRWKVYPKVGDTIFAILEGNNRGFTPINLEAVKITSLDNKVITCEYQGFELPVVFRMSEANDSDFIAYYQVHE